MDSSHDAGSSASQGELFRYAHLRRVEAFHYWRDQLERTSATEPEAFIGLVKAVAREDIALACEILRRWGIW